MTVDMMTNNIGNIFTLLTIFVKQTVLELLFVKDKSGHSVCKG